MFTGVHILINFRKECDWFGIGQFCNFTRVLILLLLFSGGNRGGCTCPSSGFECIGIGGHGCKTGSALLRGQSRGTTASGARSRRSMILLLLLLLLLTRSSRGCK